MKRKILQAKSGICQAYCSAMVYILRCCLRKLRLQSGAMKRIVAVALLLTCVALFIAILQPESHGNAISWHLSQLGRFSLWDGHLPDLSSPLAYADLPAQLGSVTAGHCKPRRSIFFLKTHKCGSSTVQNILLRHGEKHALDFVLPGRGNYIGSPAPFQARWVPADLRPRSGRFHVFAHHTRLSVLQSKRVMADDAAWVTILRDPVTQFESIYDYYALRYSWNLTLAQFISLPLSEKRALPRPGGRIGPNQMTFDLGYDPAIRAEPRLVEAMLRDIERTFDLVMIMELMDESLVLLRRLMCWATDDVVYLTKNARFESRHTPLSAEQRAALEELLEPDVTLYRHFRRRLAQQVAAVPLEAFMAQAETLVARRLFWRQRCVSGTASGSELNGNEHEITDKVQGYLVSDHTDWMCSRLAMAELSYTNLVRDAQRQRVAVWGRVSELIGASTSSSEQPPADQG